MKRSNLPSNNRAKRTRMSSASNGNVEKSDTRVVKTMTYFSELPRMLKTQVEAEACKWWAEIDKCTSAHIKRKGDWIPEFDEIKAHGPNPVGFISVMDKRPAVVKLLKAGLTVEEELQKTMLAPAHRVRFFNVGEQERLASYWLGCVDMDIPPAVLLPSPPELKVEKDNFDTVEPAEITHAPLDSTPQSLRTKVMQREMKKPTLVPPYKKFASKLQYDESTEPTPSNYCEHGWKAASLVIAYTLQEKAEGRTVKWSSEIRDSLFASFGSRFQKEFAPLVLLTVEFESTMKDYAKEANENDEEFGLGTKVRQDVTKLLEGKLKESKSVSNAFKMVARCFSKKKIKGLKEVLGGLKTKKGK